MSKSTFIYILLTLLILISGILGWSLFQQHTLSIENKIILSIFQDHNSNQRERNKFYAERMDREIEDKVKNEGDLRNQGLADTIKSILKRTDEVLKLKNIRHEDCSEYQRWVGNMYNSQLKGTPEYLSQRIIDSIPGTKNQVILKNSILKWEEQLLFLLNGRLGVGSFAHPRFGIASFSTKTLIEEGDTLKIKLMLAESLANRTYYGYYSYLHHPKYQSTSGIITQEKTQNYAMLKIPTKGLLKSGERSAEFSYYVTAQIPMSTGGKLELIPLTGKYKVVSIKR